MDNLSKTVNEIVELSRGLKKGDPYIPELIEEIRGLKATMREILEKDEEKKKQMLMEKNG